MRVNEAIHSLTQVRRTFSSAWVSSAGESVRFTPLGGLCEVGMNCAVLAHRDGLMAIDCGVGFTNQLGADMVHPDFAWLHAQGDRLKGIVVTHGHEDHIGALPYFLKRQRVPIYAPPYAASLIEARLAEHGLDDIEIQVGGAGSRFAVGPFTVERFGVHHSIADATGLIMETPVGTLVHTGDFKIESEPCDGQHFDHDRLSEVAQRGVRLLLSDSTGADVDGRSGLERDAEQALHRIVSNAKARVVVATFSSNVFRLRSALRIAQAQGRKVCLLGMSVRRHVETAIEHGWLPGLESVLISVDEAASLPRDELMVLAGGTQGEPSSSLTRLSRGEYSRLQLDEHDTVVLSSRIIPGNEVPVYQVINQFERRGIEVLTRREDAGVHASGHGCREEQRSMIRLVQPDAFVPVHGTHHHLRRHAEIAREEGIADVTLVENGTVLEVREDSMSIVDSIPVGRVYIDRMEPLDATVLEDRRAMASGGVVALTLSLRNGFVAKSIRVLSRGVVAQSEEEVLARKVAERVRGKMLGRRFTGSDDAEEVATDVARRFLMHSYRRRPLVTATAYEGT